MQLIRLENVALVLFTETHLSFMKITAMSSLLAVSWQTCEPTFDRYFGLVSNGCSAIDYCMLHVQIKEVRSLLFNEFDAFNVGHTLSEDQRRRKRPTSYDIERSRSRTFMPNIYNFVSLLYRIIGYCRGSVRLC